MVIGRVAASAFLAQICLAAPSHGPSLRGATARSFPEGAQDIVDLQPRNITVLASGPGPAAAGTLLGLIEASLGAEMRKAAEAVLEDTTANLKTLFATLPKNRRGLVDAPVVQYALNRFFVQHHSWRVRGLASEGSAWGDSSSLFVVGERMPEKIRQYFQDRLDNVGLDLHELAILGATIKALIQDEAMEQIQASYRLLQKMPSDALPMKDAREIVLLYMSCYIMGENASQIPSPEWWTLERALQQDSEDWTAIEDWFSRSLRDTQSSAFDMSAVVDIIHKAMELHREHSLWRGAQLKDNLMTLAGSSSGRVSLAEFYGSRFTKGYMGFDERKEFLRQLGALDESDTLEPRIIIPNYLLNPLNCAGPFSYYATCTLNECDPIMSELEKSLGAPAASAEAVAEVVARLPSASVSAPRILPDALVEKLRDVAEHHGGKVPLHGRLFLQWMHFAYPVECPYPFLSGTVKPMTDKEFLKATGKNSYYSDEELEEIGNTATMATSLNCVTDQDKCLAMWTPHEELLAHHFV